MDSTEEESEWSRWWNARMAAMESVLGKSDEMVGHAAIPFDMGAEVGGGADVVYFKNHLDGVGMATSELIGRDEQIRNKLGNYELLIFHRGGVTWGANVVSKLALYTCQAKLDPGQTMDIGSATPAGSTIAAFLFVDYGRFTVISRKAGLLLCIGITAAELAACRKGRLAEVEAGLKAQGIYPFTDLNRESVV